MATADSLLKKVLSRYPDCPNLPALPACSAKWNEIDFEMFVASLGEVVPQGGVELAETKTTEGEEDVAFFECGRRQSSGKLQGEVVNVSPSASGETIVSEPQIRGAGTVDACLVIPSTVYMEDRAPKGLQMDSVLTKFDRCRAAALQSICGLSTSTLVDDYGVGILLSDLYMAVESASPPAVTASAEVESEIDLAKMPFIPSRQRLVCSSGEVQCTAVFGQVLVNLATKQLSQNLEAYNRIKRPCDRAFCRELPTAEVLAVRQELAARWAQKYPSQGGPFTPRRYVKGKYVVAPSDCDTYNTLYHPKVASVCEHACLNAAEKFCCKANTVVFSRFISTLPPGEQLTTHIFFDDTAQHGTRALFAFEKDDEEGACALCVFAVYGGPIPATMYHEEHQAVTQKNGQALIAWAKDGTWKAPGACDLSVLIADKAAGVDAAVLEGKHTPEPASEGVAHRLS
eukprot:CAMPEP_0117527586 /NCGR_PEP_ID=MMETSP0784-20121206/36875_1 /TAXON_ID=39447 /ORGANISM="" /LENGTH=456 /DNA_ID=CAMNT_0005323845 /DNA_START=41 /DNA_END=1411 /DNA_ORIENTATION=-